MQVLMKINNLKANDLNTDWYKCKICRNLARIMDVKVVEVNIDKKTISFIYENPKAFVMVIDELRRIGYPVKDIIKANKAKLYKRIKREKF